MPKSMIVSYELAANENLSVFEFTSIGQHGEIHKIVQYSETNLKGFYNLGFGDRNSHTGEISDTVISNNGDSRRILATVAATVYSFTERYKGVWIYATGTTKSRTRLYRIGLTNNLNEIVKNFELYGQNNMSGGNL